MGRLAMKSVVLCAALAVLGFACAAEAGPAAKDTAKDKVALFQTRTIFHSGLRDEHTVAFTFDDGPNANTPAVLDVLKAYNIKATIARGTGYANTVTKEGWKGFAENLAIAEKALNRAWELNPKDPRTAVTMIWVQGDVDSGRDQIDLWFNRAMENDPNDSTACGAKLVFIEPKYGGSVGDMLDFGRDCVQNTNWGGTVPLVLVDAHNHICNQYIDQSERTNYWKQPDVWADIKSAYERYFQLYPNDASRIPYYAWYAYQAEDWDKLNELIPKLGPSSYYTFGGKDEFDRMVQLAKEHSSLPAATTQQQ